MDITVIIRCLRDRRVLECIDSIDEDVEVIVSTSHDDAFESFLQEHRIKYCLSAEGNLSVCSNVGFDTASFDKVIITDSDTIFEKGCIRRMFHGLDDCKIVRAKLKFDISKKIASSKLVADARDFVNSKELTFTPGIGMRKDIVKDIGGFFFNDSVPFAVDADLNYRVKRNGVKTDYLNDAIIVHRAESIRHDLKAAKRIGAGTAISARSLASRYSTPEKDVRRSLKAIHLSDYHQMIRTKGICTFFYQVVWDICYHIGSISRRLRRG